MFSYIFSNETLKKDYFKNIIFIERRDEGK